MVRLMYQLSAAGEVDMKTNGMHARKLIALGALTLALSVPVALADTVDDPADDTGAQQTDTVEDTAEDTGEQDTSEQEAQAATATPTSTNELIAAQQQFDEAQAKLQEIGAQLEQTQGLIHSTQADLKRIGSQIDQTKASYSLTATPPPTSYTSSTNVFKAFNPYRIFTSDKETGIQLSDLHNERFRSTHNGCRNHRWRWRRRLPNVSWCLKVNSSRCSLPSSS